WTPDLAPPALRASGRDGSAAHHSLVWRSIGATKCLTRSREEGFGRLFRATDGGCDLAHRQLIEIAQDHDDPLLTGKLGECRFNAGPQLVLRPDIGLAG